MNYDRANFRWPARDATALQAMIWFFAVCGGMPFPPARRAKENSPAIDRWVGGRRRLASPAGTTEPLAKNDLAKSGFLSSLWDLGRVGRGPSDKSLGYSRSSLRDWPNRPQRGRRQSLAGTPGFDSIENSGKPGQFLLLPASFQKIFENNQLLRREFLSVPGGMKSKSRRDHAICSVPVRHVVPRSATLIPSGRFFSNSFCPPDTRSDAWRALAFRTGSRVGRAQHNKYNQTINEHL